MKQEAKDKLKEALKSLQASKELISSVREDTGLGNVEDFEAESPQWDIIVSTDYELQQVEEAIEKTIETFEETFEDELGL